jgi:hypothetical protein
MCNVLNARKVGKRSIATQLYIGRPSKWATRRHRTRSRADVIAKYHAWIRAYVGEFLNYARRQPSISFELTPIGCGLAGYRPEQIAPMFSDAPPNVILPDAFDTVLAAGSA